MRWNKHNLRMLWSAGFPPGLVKRLFTQYILGFHKAEADQEGWFQHKHFSMLIYIKKHKGTRQVWKYGLPSALKVWPLYICRMLCGIRSKLDVCRPIQRGSYKVTTMWDGRGFGFPQGSKFRVWFCAKGALYMLCHCCICESTRNKSNYM